MISNKDFPSLPPPPPKSEQKPREKKKENKEVPKKQEEPEIVEIKHEKPVSYKEAEENPFQLKANKSSKNKNKNGDVKNHKLEKDFPTLGNGPSSGPMIITEKKDEIEERFGVKINKNKKGRK